MLTEPVEVYRSRRYADCAERAFMLTAVGIASELTHEPEGYVALWVEHSALEAACAHLAGYQLENRPPPPPPPPPVLHPYAWVGCAGYVLVLLAVAVLASHGYVRLDAFERGDIEADQVQRGEWWRAFTALSLHLDLAHLMANLGAGVWFGWIGGRLLGAGLAWALAVGGAAFANLIEALYAEPGYRSAGASTAVFAILGLTAAYAWRERYSLTQRWALRWAPLVAGVVLLGWTGTAGEHTDVFAHLAGFACGALLGLTAALPPVHRALARVPQWLAGAIAVGCIALAWGRALYG